MEYTKNEAIEKANQFIEKVRTLEKIYGVTFNSDTGDVYLSFKIKNPKGCIWDSINIGWDGDGSGLKVKETILKPLPEQEVQRISDLFEKLISGEITENEYINKIKNNKHYEN